MVGGGLDPPAVTSVKAEGAEQNLAGNPPSGSPAPDSELLSVEESVVGSGREPPPRGWDAAESRLGVSAVAEAFLDEDNEDARVCLRVLQVCAASAVYG